MASILPSINCHRGDTDAVAARCREVEEIFAAAGTPAEERWAHFDVADGLFTFHKSWDEPGLLARIRPGFKFEAHLMVEDQRAAAKRWLTGGARRIVAHLEAASPAAFEELAAMARTTGAELFLALNPETPAGSAKPYFEHISGFLLLTVHPGLSGQKFLPAPLSKIDFLRRGVPDAKIEIDGGITPETARFAFKAGADILVSDSAIFGSPDPAREYERLRAL